MRHHRMRGPRSPGRGEGARCGVHPGPSTSDSHPREQGRKRPVELRSAPLKLPPGDGRLDSPNVQAVTKRGGQLFGGSKPRDRPLRDVKQAWRSPSDGRNSPGSIPGGEARSRPAEPFPAGGDSLLILMFIRHTGWQRSRGARGPRPCHISGVAKRVGIRVSTARTRTSRGSRRTTGVDAKARPRGYKWGKPSRKNRWMSGQTAASTGQGSP